MNKLEQTYAWSESRVKLLRECMWQYYLNYYLSWEGWLSSAPLEKRKAYILKNMTNLPMWAGSIVHDEIESIIREMQHSDDSRSETVATSNVVQALRKGWLDSKNKRWEQNCKHHINLSEHYYGEPIEDRKLKDLKQKVVTCIKAFYDSPVFKIMCNLNKNDWLALEDFQKFDLKSGETVSVKIDCGFRYDNKVYLLDWKTGKVNSSVIDQLITYAMYAIKMGWAKKPEDVVIVPVFLAYYFQDKESSIPHITVTNEHILRQASIIKKEYPLLREAHSNKDKPEFFQHTDNENSCLRCRFRDICDGARSAIGEEETPF
jgi:hypothetical protein